MNVKNNLGPTLRPTPNQGESRPTTPSIHPHTQTGGEKKVLPRQKTSRPPDCASPQPLGFSQTNEDTGASLPPPPFSLRTHERVTAVAVSFLRDTHYIVQTKDGNGTWRRWQAALTIGNMAVKMAVGTCEKGHPSRWWYDMRLKRFV